MEFRATDGNPTAQITPAPHWWDATWHKFLALARPSVTIRAPAAEIFSLWRVRIPKHDIAAGTIFVGCTMRMSTRDADVKMILD